MEIGTMGDMKNALINEVTKKTFRGYEYRLLKEL
jgi:hypothetical protein